MTETTTIETTSTTTTFDLPKVVLKPRRALPFFNRHPWVFAGAIKKFDNNCEPGQEVWLMSSEGQRIARGLFNPHSNIKVRLYCWDESTPIDRDFWSQRLDDAISLRRRLFGKPGPESAHRLVYSEADGMSGLIVDRYGEWLIVQFTSLALSTCQSTIIELLKEKLHPRGIWQRTEKGIRKSEGFETTDGLIEGKEPPRPLFVEEHGIRFGVDVEQGQKTGFFLDQRDNRAAVAKYVKGHQVLDVFCYTGGFGLAAVKLGNAKHVHGIDVSESALTTARANAELNGVANCVEYEKSEAFQALERLKAEGKKFDTVILDPPKMSRHRAGLNKAMRGYHSLNQLAVELLNSDGILVTCSCSGLVNRDLFQEMLSNVAVSTNRRIQILEARGQSPDHPTSTQCMETEYLKCFICRVV